jgi:tRNA(His) guanylyltransferase
VFASLLKFNLFVVINKQNAYFCQNLFIMKDELGDRMKSYYEDRTRAYLPRRTYTVIRIDGKAFHTYTKGLMRPFDVGLIEDMDETTKYLCQNIQGAKMGYVQSDEISIIMTDFDKLTTSAWFDGNIQKMSSIAASIATSKFNQLRLLRQVRQRPSMPISEDLLNHKIAHFDARTFSIPSREETINYLIWRQNDATRNSISSVAQSLYSHKELNGKTTNEMQEMIFQKGQNWNNYPDGQKRGRAIMRNDVLVESQKELYDRTKEKDGWVIKADGSYWVTRSVWTAIDPPIFSKNKPFLDLIPRLH